MKNQSNKSNKTIAAIGLDVGLPLGLLADRKGYSYRIDTDAEKQPYHIALFV